MIASFLTDPSWYGAPRIIWIIIGAVLLEILLLHVLLPLISYLRSRSCPQLSVRAKVLRRDQQVAWRIPTLGPHSQYARMRDEIDGVDRSIYFYRYYVTFETEDYRRFEFRISEDQFGGVSPGDIGQLTYQGGLYRGFTREH